jgi:hypothetical protein
VLTVTSVVIPLFVQWTRVTLRFGTGPGDGRRFTAFVDGRQTFDNHRLVGRDAGGHRPKTQHIGQYISRRLYAPLVASRLLCTTTGHPTHSSLPFAAIALRALKENECTPESF